MHGGRCVGKSFGNEVGLALREARTARGLTLREVGVRSGGRFSPTAVAGYERGERSISLGRFCELARFYEIEPDGLLSEVLHPAPPAHVVDLTAFEEPTRTPSEGERSG